MSPADMAAMPDVLSISSTAVDLSRLPPPTIVEQLSYEAIFAQIVAELQARLPSFDATVDSDPAVKVLQVAAYRELLIRQRVNEAGLGVMLAHARGADLDNLAALVGVTRLTLTPADPATGIAAVMEADDALRARVVLAPESFSVAGPEAAYIFHARSASGDVLDASATSPAPGEVIVTILSRLGDGTASAELIAEVAAIVASRPIRPLTDHVTVRSAEIVPFALQALLTVYDGPDAAIITAAAEAKLADHLAAARKLGRDITLSGLYAALHVEGVQKVTLASPLADITCTRLQAAHADPITITVAGLGD